MDLLDRAICPGCKREVSKDDIFMDPFHPSSEIHYCHACWVDDLKLDSPGGTVDGLSEIEAALRSNDD